ncbi:MAG: response regulator, partial [Cyanothece sp. SIO1E1]|nr:response regulator [Cyanothece sp. SIO1E1]
MRILLVDDDDALAEVLTASLTEQHYAVDVATDGEVGWEYVSVFHYDLILLDVMLPKLDGISFCQKLRSQGYQMPILLLTARNTRMDKIRGLDAGADDYVVKPFDIEELTARIRALLRRENQALPVILQCDHLCLNPATCEVTYEGQPLQLTPKEYALLALFLRHPKRVFSLGVILDNVWSAEDPPSEDTVRTHMKGLRRKLKLAGAAYDLIETVYGLGYRLKSPPIDSEPAAMEPISLSAQTQASAAIAATWKQYRGKIISRLAVLEQTAQAFKTNDLSKELQQQARQEAHNLVGTLGTFGLAEGTQLARQLERLLQRSVWLKPDEVELFGKLVLALGQVIGGNDTGEDAGNDTGEDTEVQAQAASEHREQGAHASEQSSEFRSPRLPYRSVSPTPLVDKEPPLLLIITADERFTQPLIEVAKAAGIRTAIAPKLAELGHIIHQAQPDVVLIKLAGVGAAQSSTVSELNDLALIAAIAHQMPSLPVLVITDSDRLSDRIEVLRRGGYSCLEPSVTPTQIMAAVTHALRQSIVSPKV